MNKNPRTQHTGDSPVGGDVDRRSFLKLTGAGLGREPGRFARFVRDAAATGVWNAA